MVFIASPTSGREGRDSYGGREGLEEEGERGRGAGAAENKEQKQEKEK